MPVRLVKRFRAAGVLAALALALPATLGAQPVSPVAPPTPEQAPIAYLVDLSSGQTLYVDSGQHLLAQPRDVIYLAREGADA